MADAAAATELAVVPARWRVAAAVVLSLAGLGVSVYLTIDHFAKIPLVCSDTGVINCEKVTTSAQSHFLGIPVAVLGLAFYLAMTAINLPPLWYTADRRVHIVRLGMSAVGVLFALYLVSAGAAHHRQHLPVVHVGARHHVPAVRPHHLHRPADARMGWPRRCRGVPTGR